MGLGEVLLAGCFGTEWIFHRKDIEKRIWFVKYNMDRKFLKRLAICILLG
jgi:hypothetical protein